MTAEITCDNCKAACCHDVDFEQHKSSVDVVENMKKLGEGRVTEYVESGPGVRMLGINGKCPLLLGKSCSVHNEDSKRFVECLIMMPGDSNCLRFRKRDGL